MTNENLTPEEVASIRSVMGSIVEIANKVKETPFDPKIEVLLEIAFTCAQEQLENDRKYIVGPPRQQDERFMIDNGDIPSPDDLRRMIEGEEDDS